MPPYPGITSAMGLLTTDLKYDTIRTQFQVSGNIDLDRLNADIAAMESQLRGNSRPIICKPPGMSFLRDGDLRYVGQGYELKIPFPRRRTSASANSTEIWARFHKAHEREYGHVFPDSPIEIVNIRVVGVGQMPKIAKLTAPEGSTLGEGAGQDRPMRIPDRRRIASVRNHVSIAGICCRSAKAFKGPAIVLQKDCTTVIPPGCSAINDPPAISFLQSRGMAMHDANRSNRRPQPRPRVDPITGAVIQGALENIAIEMGHKLMRMSYSSIIRESEDFGAALTDAEGRQLCECKMSTPLQSGPIPGYIRGIRKALRSPRRRVPSGDVDHAQRSVWRRLARPGRGVLRAGIRRRRS